MPEDNPFVDQSDARAEIYAFGLRNPWRFSFDEVTGDLWAADVGEDQWEEVNLIVPGGNYGWSIMDGQQCFRQSDCESEGLEQPHLMYEHDQGCAIIGGYVYHGSSMPELYGSYIYGDFCSGKIWAAKSATDPPILLAKAQLISSFAELPNGELLVLSLSGAIFRLERKAASDAATPDARQ